MLQETKVKGITIGDNAEIRVLDVGVSSVVQLPCCCLQLPLVRALIQNLEQFRTLDRPCNTCIHTDL